MHPPKKKQNKKQTNKTHAQPLKGEGKISWRWNDNLRSNRANQEEFYSFSEFSTKVKRSRAMHCTGLSRERHISVGPVKRDRTSMYAKLRNLSTSLCILGIPWLACLWLTWLLMQKGGKPRQVVRQFQTEGQVKGVAREILELFFFEMFIEIVQFVQRYFP